MKKLLLDTNILLDLLAKRKHFYEDAARLFLMAEKNVVSLSVSSLSVVNTHYVLRKHLSEQQTRAVLRDLRNLVKVLPLDEKITDIALNSNIGDFEDAIQYHSALEYRQEIIITRNLKDFKASTLPVMTAGQYIHSVD
jgi:predicted nucleic acid-binding protein